PRPLTHNVGGAFYRPLVTYSFALQYKIAPYNIPVARTIQTLLFTTTVVLLVAFVWQMTGNAWVSTTSGALFSVWPPHHEVTTWLAGRPDLLSLLWILASLVTFHAAIRKRSIALYALTVLFASAAVLSKETGIIAIPALLYVVILRKKFRDWRVWVTVLGSAAAVCFFLFVRSIVLGQLVGSYGETQVRTSLANGVKLFRTIFEGWVNWAWLGAKFTPRIAQLLRYFAVVVLGASVLTVVALHWRSMKKEWKKFAALGVWFLIAVSLALVMVQSVNTMDLSGTRHLYLASSVLAVTIAYLIAFFKARRRIAFTVVIIFAIAWLMNVQPWVEASAENNRILTQIQLNVPNPPTQAVFDIRGLPGDTFGAYQWYAKRSIPEAVVALYHRPDLYAPTALETSPYCSPYPNGKVVRFFYTRATRNLTFLGVHDISVVGSPPAVPAQALTVTSPLPGTYVATATPQSWQGYRGLVITLDAVESGFVQLQIRGEGSTLYNRPVVRVESGRNDGYFSLCEWHAWLRSIPKREVKILTPISTTVTAAHLVAPYAL
ncbi:MAG: glycosyltransferase family 39 protein, partial [Patescibacteria group bacterium]